MPKEYDIIIIGAGPAGWQPVCTPRALVAARC